MSKVARLTYYLLAAFKFNDTLFVYISVNKNQSWVKIKFVSMKLNKP